MIGSITSLAIMVLVELLLLGIFQDIPQYRNLIDSCFIHIVALIFYYLAWVLIYHTKNVILFKNISLIPRLLSRTILSHIFLIGYSTLRLQSSGMVPIYAYGLNTTTYLPVYSILFSAAAISYAALALLFFSWMGLRRITLLMAYSFICLKFETFSIKYYLIIPALIFFFLIQKIIFLPSNISCGLMHQSHPIMFSLKTRKKNPICRNINNRFIAIISWKSKAKMINKKIWWRAKDKTKIYFLIADLRFSICYVMFFVCAFCFSRILFLFTKKQKLWSDLRN